MALSRPASRWRPKLPANSSLRSWWVPASPSWRRRTARRILQPPCIRWAFIAGAEELPAALTDAWADLRAVWDNGRALAHRNTYGWSVSGLGQQAAVKFGGLVVTGVFETTDDTGCLVIATESGAWVPISAGDVDFGLIAASRGSRLMARPDELTFAPLGGVGEIGMNLSLYGIGNRHQSSWLAVDLGVSFGDEDRLPGIDLVMPDIRFLEQERKNLVGLVLTHAQEDHFGAIIDSGRS